VAGVAVFSADVRGQPVAHRPAAGATCAGVRGRLGQMPRHATMAGVRLAVGKAARFDVSAQSTSTGSFDRLLPPRERDFAVAQDAQRDDPGLATTRNPGSVRSHGYIDCERLFILRGHLDKSEYGRYLESCPNTIFICQY
jgi:hypothetical protein